MRHRGLLPLSRGGRACREEGSSSSAITPGLSAGGGRHIGQPSFRSSSASNTRRNNRGRPLRKLRNLGCAGSWCKTQVLSRDAAAAPNHPTVSALAADMLQRGWVTPDEYSQLLSGDRIYCLQEVAQEEERRRKKALVRKLSKPSRGGMAKGLRARNKARKRNNTVGAAKVSKSKATTVTATASASVEKKTEHPADPCRDPITLDDLGSWTWDFRASEAATPPVSCGGPSFSKNGGEVSKGGGSGGGSSSGLWGRGRRCEGGGGKGGGKSGSGGSSSAVVTYNVESLVLYLLESGDFQEPTTRRPFSLVQLADLDALAAKSGAKVQGSLVTSFREGQAKYRERRERREMLVGADRCLGDVVAEMLSTVEDSDDPHEEAHVYLVTLFPQFAHIYSELKQADEEFARQCLDQYKGTLRGPPNCPTLEQGGLLRTALEFLSEQGRSATDEDSGPLDDATDSHSSSIAGDTDNVHRQPHGYHDDTVDVASSTAAEVASGSAEDVHDDDDDDDDEVDDEVDGEEGQEGGAGDISSDEDDFAT